MKKRIYCGGGVRPQAEVRLGYEIFQKSDFVRIFLNISYLINSFSLIHYKLLNK